NCNGTSVLTAAVTHGNNAIALWLLKNFGKELASLPNMYGITPLHVAASHGNIEYIRRAVKCDPKSVDSRDVFGCTPCAYAVQGGFLDVLEYLVETARAEIGCISVKGCVSCQEDLPRSIKQSTVSLGIKLERRDDQL
ncbi:ankyrin repeat protein, partial [Teladorsagia circumcincta]